MEPQIRADYKSGKTDPETDQLIGAAMEVHREPGPVNYVKADNDQHGLLLNFGSRSLEHQRFTYRF